MRPIRRYQQGGRGPGSDEPTRAQRSMANEAVGDYLDRVDPGMRGMGIERVFGPVDYVLGAFPAGRVLSPVAQKLAAMLGIGSRPVTTAAGRTAASPAQAAMNRRGQMFEEFLEQTGSPDMAADLTRRALGEPVVTRLSNGRGMIRQ